MLFAHGDAPSLPAVCVLPPRRICCLLRARARSTLRYGNGSKPTKHYIALHLSHTEESDEAALALVLMLSPPLKNSRYLPGSVMPCCQVRLVFHYSTTSSSMFGLQLRSAML